jgi:CheY-like chemotaxis protein
LRCLIVEDDDDTRALLVTLARKEGCEVAEADDGEEAIIRHTAALKIGSDFDLIILDLALPKADGISLARHFRATEKELGRKRAYILGITGYSQYVKATGVFKRAGIDDLKRKPLVLAELRELIKRLEAKR